MIKKLLSNFNNSSIRYKLFVSYLLLIAIPFCIFIAINYYISSEDTEKQALESSQKVLNQARSSIQYKTTNAKNLIDVISLNDTMKELISRDPDYYHKNIGNWLVDYDKFTKLQFSIRSNPDISSLQLYMYKGFASFLETDEFLNLKKFENTDWFKKFAFGDQQFEWYPSMHFPQNSVNKSICLLRAIPSSQNIFDFIGIIKADIPESVIKDILIQSEFTKNSAVALINSRGEIISSSKDTYFPDSLIISDVLSESDIPANGLWKTKDLENGKTLIGIQNISKTDWKLVLLVPYKDILKLTVKSRNQMLTVLLAVILLTFPASYLVAASATKRIRRLILHMRKIENGNFDVNIIPGNNDEIGELTRNYNYMLTKISMLMDDKFALGKEIKNLELKTLQAQINPHFLYNTLDLINWMSIKYKAPEIVNVVNALSKFYKLSLSKGEDVVTIESELSHITAYVKIQNARFENRIHLNVDVPEYLYRYKILKVTLQPLIENAILHGILERDEESGVINITGEISEDVIYLYIGDTGVGMPEEKVKSILLMDSENESSGYGVKNIDQRLKLNFGNEFGLSYSSKPGIGTIVTVKLPAL